MTTEDFVNALIAEMDALPGDSPAAAYLACEAAARIRGAGREYEVSDDLQGFETLHPVELCGELEAEIADAAAWAVALKLIMSRYGMTIHIRSFLFSLQELIGDLSCWRLDAREIPDNVRPIRPVAVATDVPAWGSHPHKQEGS